METQMVFKRYELKFLLDEKQKEIIMQHIMQYMLPDEHGCTTIRNIYFDTDNYRLARRSIDKPEYKEKIRLRSYRQAEPHDEIYVELKKKYNDVVFKRRMMLPEILACEWIAGRDKCPSDTQISQETDYFIRFYGGLKPTAFISYDREAYCSCGGTDLRITFDKNILCRQEEMSMKAGIYGERLLPEGMTLMEIKALCGIPVWLAGLLSGEKIYKTSYSKYGVAYKQIIYPAITPAGRNGKPPDFATICAVNG